MERIPEDIAENLPPPRADEPASLRQDILDELRDHLQCAVRREQLLGATDPPTAWQCVLARFGNPTEIAQKLYWQAMWSRIMQQRIVFAGGVGMLVACVAMMGFMWVMLERQQQQADRQQAWAERQQANFETMLTRLNTPPRMFGSLIVQVDHPVAEIRLSGGALQKPANGVLVNLSDRDAPHDYDFGEISPGIYELFVLNKNHFYLTQQLVIKTGESHLKKIRVPDEGPPASITFTSNLPAHPPGNTLISLDLLPKRKTFEGREWVRNYLSGFYIGREPRPAGTELKGRVQLTLTYRLDVRSSQIPFTAELGPPQDDHLANTANCLYHVIEFNLKPGQNECHVELPKDWIESLPKPPAYGTAPAVYAPPAPAVAPTPAAAPIHSAKPASPNDIPNPEPARPAASPVSK